MSYKASFLDNQVVGVDDFNSILQGLLGKGIVPAKFEADVPYSLKAMNDVTASAVAEAGVVPESEAALSVAVTGDTVVINPGKAVFSSGVMFTVTEPEILAIDTSVKQYVFLFHDKSTNRAEPGVSAEMPFETEAKSVILLASAENGQVTDLRKYARGKLSAVADWNGTRKSDFTYTGMIDTSHGEQWVHRTVTLGTVGDRVNFLLFVSGIKNGGRPYAITLVTEPVRGTFEVVGITAGGGVLDLVALDSSEKAKLENFKRGETGVECTLSTITTKGSETNRCILYSSVYEEGDA